MGPQERRNRREHTTSPGYTTDEAPDPGAAAAAAIRVKTAAMACVFMLGSRSDKDVVGCKVAGSFVVGRDVGVWK